MKTTKIYDVIIVGGGLAGLTSSLKLRKEGYHVLLLEKNEYPYHKVCGEYVSMEVLEYLKNLGFDPFLFGAKEIQKLRVTGINGLALEAPLDLGAFGISRFKMDNELFQIAKEIGVEVLQKTEVVDIIQKENSHEVSTKNGQVFNSKTVLAAYGKRTKLDKQFGRSFMEKRSPYVGVKYHIKINAAQDLISLHNFQDGYCGMSAVEGDVYCLCYLTHRNNFDKYKSVTEVEENVLKKNPYLKEIFEKAEFLYDKPLVINEITFEKKSPVENGMLMIGDTAGMITPLCGNGMAMAIHGGKLASEAVISFLSGNISRSQMEKLYTESWNKNFERRLWAGRNIQKFFGQNTVTNASLKLLKWQPKILDQILKLTHGEVVIP